MSPAEIFASIRAAAVAGPPSGPGASSSSSTIILLPRALPLAGQFAMTLHSDAQQRAFRLLVRDSEGGQTALLHLELGAGREHDRVWARFKSRLGQQVVVTQAMGAGASASSGRGAGSNKPMRMTLKPPRGPREPYELRGTLALGVRIEVQGPDPAVFEFGAPAPDASWLSSQSSDDVDERADATRNGGHEADHNDDEIDELMGDDVPAATNTAATKSASSRAPAKRARSRSTDPAITPGAALDQASKRARTSAARPFVSGWTGADMIPGKERRTTSIAHLTRSALDGFRAETGLGSASVPAVREGDSARSRAALSSPFDVDLDPIQRASGTVAPYTPGPSSPMGEREATVREVDSMRRNLSADTEAAGNWASRRGGSPRVRLAAAPRNRTDAVAATPTSAHTLALVAAPGETESHAPNLPTALVTAAITDAATTTTTTTTTASAAPGPDPTHKPTKKQRKAENKAKKRAEQQGALDRALIEREAKLLERFAADPVFKWEGRSRSGQKLVYKTLEQVGANDEEGSGPGRVFSLTQANLIVGVKQVFPGKMFQDYAVNIDVQDPTRHGDDHTKITFYSKQVTHMDSLLKAGDVVLIRHVSIQRPKSFQNRITGQCRSGSRWEVLALRLDPNGAQHWQAISSFGSLAVIDYSLEEQQHLRLLARWYSALRAGPTAEGAAETFKVVKQGRETVTLREFRPHCFFDLNCVQIVGRLDSPDDQMQNMLVTDYTGHDSFTMHADWEGVQPGMVMEITFYDEDNCRHVRDLPVGSYISIKNVQVRIDNRGSLAGRVNGERDDRRSNYRSTQKVKVLGGDDPAVLVVQKRQADIVAGFRPAPQRAPPPPKQVVQATDDKAAESETESDVERAEEEAKQCPVFVEALHPDKNHSTFTEMLSCRTIPNRFKVKALVSSLIPGPVSNVIIKWCRTCDRRFHKHSCEYCGEVDAEFRWRLVAVLKEKRGKSEIPEVPVILPHRLTDFLPPLPSYHVPGDADEVKEQEEAIKKMYTDVGNLLLGFKVNNRRPCPAFTWNIETYQAKDPKTGKLHRMFRAFDMQESGFGH